MSGSAGERSSSALQSRCAIIGIGNPLRGDDGVGPIVVEALIRHGLPDRVTAIDAGTGGLQLLGFLLESDRAVIVDAADLNLPAGEYARFAVDQAQLSASSDRFTLHNAGLADVLALACALGLSLPPIVVFGVQMGTFNSWGEGLSPPVEAAVPGIVAAVLREVDAMSERSSASSHGGRSNGRHPCD